MAGTIWQQIWISLTLSLTPVVPCMIGLLKFIYKSTNLALLKNNKRSGGQPKAHRKKSWGLWGPPWGLKPSGFLMVGFWLRAPNSRGSHFLISCPAKSQSAYPQRTKLNLPSFLTKMPMQPVREKQNADATGTWESYVPENADAWGEVPKIVQETGTIEFLCGLWYIFYRICRCMMTQNADAFYCLLFYWCSTVVAFTRNSLFRHACPQALR